MKTYYITYKHSDGEVNTCWTTDINTLIWTLTVIRDNPTCELVEITTADC